jgi:hypothetical protein
MPSSATFRLLGKESVFFSTHDFGLPVNAPASVALTKRSLATAIGVEFATSGMGIGEYLPERDLDRSHQADKFRTWLPSNRKWWRNYYREGARALPSIQRRVTGLSRNPS